MTVPRIYFSQKMQEGDRVKLGSEDLHYIKTVLRLKRGDILILFDGMCSEYDAVIRDFTTQDIILEITKKKETQVDHSIRITLAQALPKGTKMDFIIRKASELGVGRIIPFISSRSIPRPSVDRIRLNKTSRWKKIAIEASRKCGRGNILEITDIVTCNEVLQFPEDKFLKIIFWEEESNTGIKEILRDKKYERTTDFFIIVGPEGGFSREEIEMASRAGFLSASLGGLVLMVETAVLVILSILQYEKGNFGVTAKKE